MGRALVLKIDVDTRLGMQRGVPRLLSLLAAERVRASFFLSMGPDASGLAVFQLIRNPRFLKKMLRTRAPQLYGLRTLLYGTLLPSPLIALAFPGLVREILAAGHEAAFHAWDHRRWQDTLERRPASWIRRWFDRGVAAFQAVADRAPEAFGAPAWLVDDRVLALLGNYPFRYLSCSRAPAPFVETVSGLIEMPSDLPCVEEVGAEPVFARTLAALETDGFHVLPVHAEVEGGPGSDAFVRLLRVVRNSGAQCVTLAEAVSATSAATLPRRTYRRELLPGRATDCCA